MITLVLNVIILAVASTAALAGTVIMAHMIITDIVKG